MDNYEDRYMVIWFEDDDMYALATPEHKELLLTKEEAQTQCAEILLTETDVENAVDDLRYAIPCTLMEELFGWDAHYAYA